MGKKNKTKKGKGAEKTAQKTDKKADKKVKKILKAKGEDDIEALIAEFQEKDRKQQAIIEEKCQPPSPRCNMSLTAHPDKDELIMFGGEYFNGSQTFMYNDLLFFNTRTKEWTQVKAPNGPAPRCAHQAVALGQGGGQLWIFGGEFASPSQSQFYHYKDLWCYHLKERLWEKISAPQAPTSRSGHRMVACKRQLIVFGGFHDNIRDYKYYNDLHAFNLDTFTWSKLEVSGLAPSPRSGCQLAAFQDQRHILVYGGYSKERLKKDVDNGKVHADMFMLTPEGKNKDDLAPNKWKWTVVKQSGVKPTPRCGFSLAATPGNRAMFFGGVFDQEDEEEVEGAFYNELYTLDLETGKWHEVQLRGKKDEKEKKRRRKMKTNTESEDMDQNEENEDGEEEDKCLGDNLEKMKVDEEINTDSTCSGAENMAESEAGVFKVTVGPQTSSQVTTYDDGIFTVTMGPQGSACGNAGDKHNEGQTPDDLFIPCKRMNALMTVKHGVLYLYGGIYEIGDKQVTLADMYALDLHKLDEWKTILADDISSKEWVDSDSSDEEEEEGAIGGEEDSSEGDEDEESDMEEEVPAVRPGESLNDYFGHSKDYWLEQADTLVSKDSQQLTGKQLKKAAFQMAEEFFKQQGES